MNRDGRSACRVLADFPTRRAAGSGAWGLGRRRGRSRGGCAGGYRRGPLGCGGDPATATPRNGPGWGSSTTTGAGSSSTPTQAEAIAWVPGRPGVLRTGDHERRRLPVRRALTRSSVSTATASTTCGGTTRRSESGGRSGRRVGRLSCRGCPGLRRRLRGRGSVRRGRRAARIRLARTPADTWVYTRGRHLGVVVAGCFAPPATDTRWRTTPNPVEWCCSAATRVPVAGRHLGVRHRHLHLGRGAHR